VYRTRIRIKHNDMSLKRFTAALPGVAALALSFAAFAPSSLNAQGGSEARQASTRRVRSEAIARGRYAVVVDVDAHRLYFVRGRRVMWSAPAGVGTGLRLSGDQDAWDFSTPNGVYHVQYKALDPVWEAPDWYFVENGLPVPPQGDRRRLFPGDLGAAAVYLGDGLAIHGTNHPELLGQRISHGCIRLSNADALRLFHEVQPGTEVVIVGGGHVSQAEAAQAAARNRAAARSGGPDRPQRDPALVALERLSDDELIARLDEELSYAGDDASATPAWTTVAAVAVERALKDRDDDVLNALLNRAGALDDGPARDEFAAYLADLYTRGTLRTLEALGRLDWRDREAAASAIVAASLNLYPGSALDRTAPWPTTRAPREAVAQEAQDGWDALHEAEDRVRRSLSADD
jgi:lipoprotein-anchoring transpeptidase ErfK/SrfK